MAAVRELVDRLLELRRSGQAQVTLLAVCPNSAAVLEAAVKVAAENAAPILLAATLNQVDRDGGYTGWTPSAFVRRANQLAATHGCQGSVYACLDHGGPWLKDSHAQRKLSLDETMAEVKLSLTACIEAGYQLLHIDPTVDRSLSSGDSIPISLIIARTLELIEYSEAERVRLGVAPISYEVGTEEVHGGLADLDSFAGFLTGLREGLERRSLLAAWPCFVVGKVGTDLHTTYFDPEVAARLFEIVSSYGSLIKGHYTDWVSNPAMYPQTGMGGANVGPEFTGAEYHALADLCAKEQAVCRGQPGRKPSGFMLELQAAVLRSGRWQKWLLPQEAGLSFEHLSAERREWLVLTGARYVWTDPEVLEARRRLYANLGSVRLDPDRYVIDRIAMAIDRYIVALNLCGANQLFYPVSIS